MDPVVSAETWEEVGSAELRCGLHRVPCDYGEFSVPDATPAQGGGWAGVVWVTGSWEEVGSGRIR